MKIVTVLSPLLLLALSQLTQAKVLGVPESKDAVYQDSNGKFRCLDGSAEISFTAVNDDYCDCRDGSDEPGTSACPQSQFTCKNSEYLPVDIPASWVGDGICDCCDGSDEKKISCPNTCAQKGASARAEALKAHTAQVAGWQKRQDYVKQAADAAQKRAITISELKTKLAALEQELKLLLEAKEQAEEKEKLALERQRQKESEEAPLTKKVEVFCTEFHRNVKALNDEVNRLRDLLVSLKEISSDETLTTSLSSAVSQADSVLSKIPTFPSLCLNPEGGHGGAPSHEGSHAHHHDHHHDHYHGHDHDHDDHDHDHDDDDHYHDDDDIYHDDEHQAKVEEKLTAGIVDPEVTAAIIARDDYTSKESQVKETKTQLHNLERIQEVDLGTQGEYFHIYEKCFEYHNPEYTYEFCPFSSCTQKSKKGGSHTSLGTFVSWSGPEPNQYSSMKFDNGLKCWGGPNRSTNVKFICGDKEELLSVEEPAKCEYSMAFATPLACGEPRSVDELFKEAATRKKDEL